MNPLTAIDRRVIALHQHVIDATQRQPIWLAQQVAIAHVVVCLVRGALFDYLVFMAVCMAASAWGLLMMLRSASRGVAFPTPFRTFALAFLLFDLALACFAPGGWMREGLRVFSTALLTAVFYFLSCTPPRPRVPRHRTAPSPA